MWNLMTRPERIDRLRRLYFERFEISARDASLIQECYENCGGDFTMYRRAVEGKLRATENRDYFFDLARIDRIAPYDIHIRNSQVTLTGEKNGIPLDLGKLVAMFEGERDQPTRPRSDRRITRCLLTHIEKRQPQQRSNAS